MSQHHISTRAARPLTPGIIRAISDTEPRTENELYGYVRSVLGFDVPRTPMVPENDPPFAYLAHAFFEDRPLRDCVVWAGRGGGKTQLGAIATLLDLRFKPGIQVRILGGSLEQSAKMYRYLRTMLERAPFRHLVAGNITGRSVELTHGSRVEILSQSEKAVRGQRVHKLRCDEVEEFDEEIWQAAQLVTRSGRCGDHHVIGTIEALSTMHRPFGLMQRLIKSERGDGREAKADRPRARRVFRWSVLDTLERCPATRPCETCPIIRDCGGRAKSARGFFSIDDAVQQHGRVEPETWRSEMLCERPSRRASVFPEFDPAVHIAPLPAERPNARWVGGMDFGYRAPTVLLWAVEYDEGPVRMLHVVDELAERERTTAEHVAFVQQRDWPALEWIGADPAGHQRNEQTGVSTISLWRRAGFAIRTLNLRLEAGLLAKGG